jgi:hypothetical protein
MKWYLIASLLVSTTTIHARPALAGGEVGNGGDTVKCVPGGSGRYEGYYSLDYLATLDGTSSPVVEIASWAESKQRLLTQLGDKYPDLARLLGEFLALVPMEGPADPDHQYLKPRIWEEAPFGLVDIHDERLIKRLPVNCYTRPDEGGAASILQTVIRQKQGFATLYSYDPQIYRELRTDRPLQYSFLMVHEWLWDLTQDVQTIRRVNHFLHSTQLDHLSAPEVRASLENLGFSLKRLFVPVCQRTLQIRESIEKQMQLPCDQIAPEKLSKVELWPTVSGTELHSLAPGDLSGLSISRMVTLSHNHLDYLFEDMFSGLFLLDRLDLSYNELTELPAGIFSGLEWLGELDLSHNRLKTLPHGVLRAKDLQRVRLGGNLFDKAEIQRIQAEYADLPNLRIQF